MYRRWLASLALALAAALATETASRFVAWRFPVRPVAPDLLHGWLPHLPAASYITLAAMSAMLALFWVRVLRTSPGRAPEYVCVLALMYLLRAPLLVLTPLAMARDGSAIAFPLFANGLFPSGHTALALLLVLLTDPVRAPRARLAQMALLGVVAVTMLFSRGHYSIDIVGGLLLGFFVYRTWSERRVFRRLQRMVSAEAPARL